MSSLRHPLRRTAGDSFLYSKNDKSEYDWLVTPPDSPSKPLVNQLDASDANVYSMALKSRLEKYCKEEGDNISSENQTIGVKQPASSSNVSRSTTRSSTPIRRYSNQAMREKTPTSTAPRVTLTSTPTRRPCSSGTSTTARTTLTSSTRSSESTTIKPSTSSTRSRPSTSITSHANLTTACASATTSIARQPTGSATSTRPMSAPTTKPGSRSSTPTRRPPTPTGSATVLRSKPFSKPAPSPTLRSRPWEPHEMPGFSLEAPSNLRTTLPDRPQTASSSRTASLERGVARRLSCSPSRNRAQIGNMNGPVSSLRGRRAKASNGDGDLISHVATENQMVEKNVNIRKYALPRLTKNQDRGNSTAEKSSSGSGGFGSGRNLSKSSINMALRHLDVRRGSMMGNFRPLMTKVPTDSLHSTVRSSGSRRKRPVSSSGSSETSVNILSLDGSNDNLSDMS